MLRRTLVTIVLLLGGWINVSSSQLLTDTAANPFLTITEPDEGEPHRQRPTLTGSYALEFDGVDDVLLVQDDPSLDLNSAISIEAWVYPYDVITDPGGGNITFVRKGNVFHPMNYYIGLYVGDGGEGIGYFGFTGGDVRTEEGGVTISQWQHIAIPSRPGGLVAFHEGEPGVIRLAVINVEGVIDKQGAIARLAFQSRDDGFSAAAWTVESLSIYDLDSELLTDVEETSKEETSVPMTCALYPNTPNPFNASTTIRFSVSDAQGSVQLAIYDLLGRKVCTLRDGPMSPGTYAVTWDGRDGRSQEISSGIYVARLRVDGKPMQVRKMMLLR